MHCTNGIVAQLPSESNQQLPIDTAATTTTVDRTRRRSFKPIENEICKYISRKREPPKDDYSLLKLQSNDEIDFKSSCLIDFIWVVLKERGKKIPNWTGFNYLISKTQEEKVHQIAYLPAINASPTKLDTVLEILIQSKAKAENMGLRETDVVMDQAIYTKAVEVLANPLHKNLKDFIVLRMGAFHTTCIFLAIIGKRFGDAGLRDLIVEADLLGKNLLSIRVG